MNLSKSRNKLYKAIDKFTIYLSASISSEVD